MHFAPRGALSQVAAEGRERPGEGPGTEGRGTEKGRQMFAVLKTGGKQYRVQAGDVLRIELVAAEAGDKIQFNDILMVGSTVGAPLVAGAAVQAEVIDTVKADKVITYHKRRRKHSSQRTRGHRQKLTVVRITDILEKGAEKSDVKAAIGTAEGRRAAHAVAAAPAKKATKAAKKPAAEPVTAEQE
jgi:large subunit ribosomal protein L21